MRQWAGWAGALRWHWALSQSGAWLAGSSSHAQGLTACYMWGQEGIFPHVRLAVTLGAAACFLLQHGMQVTCQDHLAISHLINFLLLQGPQAFVHLSPCYSLPEALLLRKKSLLCLQVFLIYIILLFYIIWNKIPCFQYLITMTDYTVPWICNTSCI